MIDKTTSKPAIIENPRNPNFLLFILLSFSLNQY